MNLEKVTLSTDRVRLEPLAQGHLPGLADAIRDGRLWEIPVTFVPPPESLQDFLQDADSSFAVGRELAFSIIDIDSSAVVGSTRFRCIEKIHRRVEIGFTFIANSWQRSHVNTESKYLMLRHAFEAWQCNRVELLTDERNARSRAAIMRLGAREEGILRHHMVMRDGFVRNSAIYSITMPEWPERKARLEAMMQRHVTR